MSALRDSGRGIYPPGPPGFDDSLGTPGTHAAKLVRWTNLVH